MLNMASSSSSLWMYGLVFFFQYKTMVIQYNKPHLSLNKQLKLLQERGIKVTDKDRALCYLQHIGYYRLSAYWYPFRESITVTSNDKTITTVLDNFKDGTLFSHAVDLYVFDKKLRLLLLDALERIEVNVRVDIVHHLGTKDPFVHMNPTLLHGNFTKKTMPDGDTKYQKWQERYKRAITDSNEEFVKHFRNKYSGDLPIWMAIELWDFGLLSTFFQGMAVADKQTIANKYNIPRWKLLEGWLHSMNYIRNVCTHHSRMWNRSLTRQPNFPKRNEILELDHIAYDAYPQSRIYGVIAIMQYLLKIITPKSSWSDRLQKHCDSFPECNGIVSLVNAGFPDRWKEFPLWK